MAWAFYEWESDLISYPANNMPAYLSVASWHGSSIFFQSEARCGKAVCQSIDFPEFFAPARPHLFSGHYVGVPCMRISAMYVERMSPGGGRVPQAPPQALTMLPSSCWHAHSTVCTLYFLLSLVRRPIYTITQYTRNTTTQYTLLQEGLPGTKTLDPPLYI